MQQTIRCPNCGSTNAAGSQFCGSCGVKFIGSAPPQAIRCSSCGAPGAAGQQFCGSCGARLTSGCPYCGAGLEPSARFCPNCGAGLAGGMPPQTGGMPQQMRGAAPMAGAHPSSISPFLTLLLIVLVCGLGFFSYWAFASPSWLPPLFSSSSTDITTPAISNVTASTTNTTATITWKTDELSSSQVVYGTTSTYGQISPATPQNDPSIPGSTSMGVVTHSISLTGLTPETAYHFSVRSKNKAGNEAMSADSTFTTTATTTE